MDDESCDAKSMENIFSSYCNQKKVPRQLLMGQSVEVVRSLPHDIKYITLKLAVGFNSYKLLGWTKMETRFPHRLVGSNSTQCKYCLGDLNACMLKACISINTNIETG